MIVNSSLELMFGDVFFEMRGILPHVPVYLKLEGFNVGRSIKMKAAINIIGDLEKRGILHSGSKVVESSSGNLGLALSIVCSIKGYAFTCVSDPNITEQTRRLIEVNGGKIVIVDQRDANGGFLNTRIDLIKHWLTEDPDLVWINQYANPANKEAHMQTTGPEILRHFPDLDYLFIAAGTTGTLMGCAEFFRQREARTQIIAVDTEGSVTFGHPAGPRYIPGVGTSRKPELVDTRYVDEVLMIPEQDTVLMCHWVRHSYGLLVGGSTGTVLCGVKRLQDRISNRAWVVAISPDFGDAYADTLYNHEWVLARFPMLDGQLDDLQPGRVHELL
jgi:cysteine synthase A